VCVCSISLLSSPPQAKLAKKGAAAKNPDAKWHAVVQLAVTALDEAGGDLEHIGESSTLQDATLAALKRARLPAYKKLHADIMNDRSAAIDLLNASTWSFASPPVTKLQMPSSLTPAKKRARLRKVAGTTLLIEPLRPIPPGAVRARAWYGNTYGGLAPESADYFFGVWRSRTEELIADNLLHPTMATTTRPCPTDDQRPTPPTSATTLHTAAVRDGRVAGLGCRAQDPVPGQMQKAPCDQPAAVPPAAAHA